MRLSGRVAVVALFALARLSMSAEAQSFTVPQYVGFVNDFANIIPADTRGELESLSQRVKTATGGEMVIVTLADLGGRAQEDVAREIGRQWKVGSNTAIGDKTRNAGIIILVVSKETSSDSRGACRIETGNGVEGFVTDATAGALCRDAVEFFKQKKYAEGIQYLATRVAGLYAKEFNVSVDGVPPPDASDYGDTSRPGSGGTSIVTLVIIAIVLISIFSRRGRGGGCLSWLPFILASGGSGRGRGGWGGGGGFGGGGGGGFGGFGGGGGFSGGGGGSNW